MICAESSTYRIRKNFLVYCHDSPETKFLTAMKYLESMNCSHTIYDTAEWHKRDCLTIKYQGVGNSIVRGYYGDWLKFWAGVSTNIGIVQLEVLQDYGQDVLNDVHKFIGVRKYTYAEGTFHERFNIAKSLRAHLNVSGRFVGTSQVKVHHEEEIAIKAFREDVYARPTRKFCKFVLDGVVTTLGLIYLCR